ncbi:MAG: elongation factor Ts [Dehalococcoidia bacterium]
MAVTVEQIRTLRESTGAGILECKQALEDNGGDFDKAAEALRQKGFAQAAKRANRETSEGVIESYIHTGGRVGALVELGCETDFVARTPEFKQLAHDIAMQVAAMSPAYVSAEEIAEDDTRPPAQVSLLQQPFIKDGSRVVADMVQELAAKVGENVRVVRFSRLALEE